MTYQAHSRIARHLGLAGSVLLLAATLGFGWATRAGKFPLASSQDRHPSMVQVQIPASEMELRWSLAIADPDPAPPVRPHTENFDSIRKRLLANMAFDHYFPLAYWLFVLTLIPFALTSGTDERPGIVPMMFGAAVAVAITTTVVFDYRENAGTLALLHAPNLATMSNGLQALIDPMRRASQLKWGWLGASMLLFGMMQVVRSGSNPSRGEAIRAIAAFSGGALGVLGSGLLGNAPVRGFFPGEMNFLGVVMFEVIIEAIPWPLRDGLLERRVARNPPQTHGV